MTDIMIQVKDKYSNELFRALQEKKRLKANKLNLELGLKGLQEELKQNKITIERLSAAVAVLAEIEQDDQKSTIKASIDHGSK